MSIWTRLVSGNVFLPTVNNDHLIGTWLYPFDIKSYNAIVNNEASHTKQDRQLSDGCMGMGYIVIKFERVWGGGDPT